jgi:hypothetical protein
MMKLKYSPESIEDLQRVVENKNLYAIRTIAIDLQERVYKLKQFPEIGLHILKATDPEKMRCLCSELYGALSSHR